MNPESSMNNAACLCGSGASYAACCGRYHAGLAAPSAEALMRSRYAAYVLGLHDYLASTWHASTRPDPLQIEQGCVWMKLEILRLEAGGEGDGEGLVEFKAHWMALNGRGCLHETSRFLKENGRWYYLDGVVRAAPAAKVGRNDPCPCGSGKKYKRCCA